MNFVHELFIACWQITRLPFLKLWLNELVVPHPGLTPNNLFDQKIKKAIVDFKSQYNRKNLLKPLPLDAVVNAELWAAIGISLGEKRVNEEIGKLRDKLLIRMLQRELDFGYTEAMKICDKKLADIFGGEGAVVATVFEPRDLRHADGGLRHVYISPRPEAHSAIPRNDIKNWHERGGIIHGYTNAQGLPADVGLYAPKGFGRFYEVKDEKGKAVKLVPGKDNTHHFYSEEKKLYVNFAHVKTEGVNGIGTKKQNGSIKIGNIGGPGGDGGDGYVHSHLAFYSEYFGNMTTGTRVDPRNYFCK